VSAELLGGDREVDGLQQRVGRRSRARLGRGRPVSERQKTDLLHARGCLSGAEIRDLAEVDPRQTKVGLSLPLFQRRSACGMPLSMGQTFVGIARLDFALWVS